MKSSFSKQGADNNRGVSGTMFTLHQRLHHALSLGVRYYDDKGPNWSFTDFDIQRLVIRSIDAFLDCLSSEILKHPLVKDSTPGMVGALASILGSKSQATLILASEVAVKIVNVLPSSMLESYFPGLVSPLSSLLSSDHSQVSVSSAAALNSILSNLSIKREKEVWEILKQKNVVGDIVQNVKGFSIDNKPIEFFQEMASLLSKILQRWPPSRFGVYTDIKLLDHLNTLTCCPDISIKASVLQLYSAIALCLNGAKKILQNGENLLKMMVDSMDISKPYSIQMEAFKLAQCLMMSKEECSSIIKICGEPIVKAVITGMGNLSSDQKLTIKDQMSRRVEACRLALITRWVGEHHNYFWRAGIDEVLFKLLMDTFGKDYCSLHSLPLREKIVKIQEGLQTNSSLPLRPYVWDILGYLAAYSAEDCNPIMHGHEPSFNSLLVCACLGFVDSISATHQIGQDTCAHECVSRAVLMMIYSPWKYLANQTRYIISEVLASNNRDYVGYFLNTLRTTSSGNEMGMPSNLQVVISLMSLACFSILPKYRRSFIELQGVSTLLTFIRWWILNPLLIKRLWPNIQNPFCVRACCWDHFADWEGEEILLLLGLWCLAILVWHSGCSSEDHVFLSDYLVGPDEAQFVEELQQICYKNSSPGSTWYAAYILWHLGFYGFPNKFGQRIQKALNENHNSDLELIFASQESIYVHGVMLSVRCPSLLPSKEPKEKHESPINKVRLSAHVDYQTFAKVLEYIYSGYFQAGEDLVKKLKIYAKRCNLYPLLHMLDRRTPMWGNPLPRFDLTCALGLAGNVFSDIIIEAETSDLPSWRCNICCSLVPHYHLHKVILCSSCDYLQALFKSGMQESHLATLKVPVRWESLVKLVNWFYSGELPRPVFGCLWDNSDIEDKLREVRPYVELCWLTEFWLLDDLHEDCFSVVESCLDSCRHLSYKIIQIAADLSQWKLVEVAIKYAAPLYHRVRDSGELDAIDENLVEMIRAASVQLSQAIRN